MAETRSQIVMTDETREIVLSLLVKMKETYEDGFAQINEQLHAFRLSLRSRDRKEENPEDQICNDEELAEIEAETKSNGSEDRAVENEANATMISAIDKDESIPQFQVPIANSEILKSSESGKVDLGLAKLEVGGDVERDQEVMSDTETSCAHKVLVKMPSKEKRIKHLKGWKFKFKRKSLVGIKLQIEQYKLSNRRRRMYNKLSTNVKVESVKEMITGNHPRMLRQLHKSRVQSKMRMMNNSWSMRQPTLKIMKSHRKHKWKSKQLQIASNFWINHSHKLADLVLRTALTDWRTKLRVRKHDNLIWKEDVSDESRSRPSRCIVKLGDATITCKNLLEKSYDKNLDTVAWRNRPGRSEISNEKESRPEVMDMNQELLYHQIGHGVDILLVPKLLVHDKEGAVLPQRSKSLKISDCSDRSSRANRVWKPGGLLSVPNKKFEAELEICYKRDRVLKCYFLSEIPFAEFIEFKACKKELSVAGLRQLSLASMTFELRNVEDGVKQDTNRFSGDVGAKILMAFEELHLLQDVLFEMVKELLLKTNLIIQQVMRDKKIRLSKRWWFKYRFDEEDQGSLQSRAGERRNHGLFIRLHSKQKQRKGPKSWMFKFKTGSKLTGTSHLKRHKESGLVHKSEESERRANFFCFLLS